MKSSRNNKNDLEKDTIGIDEAGRGPLAGPIAVCALRVFDKHALKKFPTNCDSKKYSKKKREGFFRIIMDECKKCTIDYKVILVSSVRIDKKGIEESTRFGIQKVLSLLGADPKKSYILLDGRLKAPAEYLYQKTYIRGDSLKREIGLASIVAKITRDTHMMQMEKKYPQYGFSRHMGYGTLEHRKAISKYGPSKIHRKTFLKNIN